MAISNFGGIKKVSFADEYNEPHQEELLDDDIELELDDDANNDIEIDDVEESDNEDSKVDSSSPSETKETETDEEDNIESLKLSDEDKELLQKLKLAKEKENQDDEFGLNNKQKIAKRELSWEERKPDIEKMFEEAKKDIIFKHKKAGKTVSENMALPSVTKKQMIDYLSEVVDHNPNLPTIKTLQKKEIDYLLDEIFDMLDKTLERGAKPGGYLNFKRTFQGVRKLNIGKTIYNDHLKDDELLLQTANIVLTNRHSTPLLIADMEKDLVTINGNRFIKVIEKDDSYVGYKSGIVYNDELNEKLKDRYVEQYSLQRTIAEVRSRKLDKKK